MTLLASLASCCPGTAVRIDSRRAVLGRAAPSGASSAPAFAQSVLAEATVPPGGQPTRGIHTLEVRWLGGWGDTPGVGGVVGAHAFYLYDEPPATVAHYIRAHPPSGAISTGYGTHDGVVTAVTETLAVSGPDEYMAALTYKVAPTNGTGTRSELRIDAKIVWVPPRLTSELATSGESAQVTGYRTSSVRSLPSGPATVTLSPSQTQRVIEAFDSLSLGPPSVGCLEGVQYFTLVIRPRSGAVPSFRATENQCGNQVYVTENGKTVTPLWDQHCALLEAVGAVVPDRATATKRAAAACSRSST